MAWTLVLVVMLGLLLTGHVSDVPYKAYVAAGQRWRERAPLYELSNIDGFQYLPQSAAFFSLLARLGPPLSDVLWRAACWLGFASGLWLLTSQLCPSRARAGWLIATCLTIAPAANALGNGQANLALAAVGLHATVALLRGRWGLASALLSLGFALKPLMLVPLLLVVALHPRTRLPTFAWLLGLALLPVVVAGPGYAFQQYSDCVMKLRSCAQPDRLFEDLSGLLTTLHVPCPSDVLFAIRAGCALLVLVLCARMRQRMAEPWATTYVMALAMGYLVLFNPRTLSTSYVMPAAIAAPLVAAHLHSGRRRGAAILAGTVLAWNINHHLVPFVQHWLNPLAGIVFCAQLALRCRPPVARAPA